LVLFRIAIAGKVQAGATGLKFGVITYGWTKWPPDHSGRHNQRAHHLPGSRSKRAPITVEQQGPPIIPGNPVFGAIPAAPILNTFFGLHDTTTIEAGIVGPPIIPAGITNALNTFLDHELSGPPITVEQSGPPIIPGNPVFGDIPAAPILNTFFGLHDTTTIDVLGVADLHHDTPLG